LADVGWNSLYWNNHDQPRAVSRFGNDQAFRVESAKLLGTVLHLQRGTPYVYQGEELGMTNTTFDTVESFRDIESINELADALGRRGLNLDAALVAMTRMSRDNARTPMQWTTGPQAGFTGGTPWIPVNPNHTSINAEDQQARDDSVFGHYRRLIELRHDEPAVVHGDFNLLLADHPTVFAYTRRWQHTELLVLANMADAATAVDLAKPAEPESDWAGWSGAELLLGNYAPSFTGLTATHLDLRPWEAVVLRRALAVQGPAGPVSS
jgi:oligo-1,6-glucosidase